MALSKAQRKQWQENMALVADHKDLVLVMGSDSTTAVYKTVDTDIGEDQAWFIYGAEIWFEQVADGLPSGMTHPGLSGAVGFHALLMRGTQDTMVRYNNSAFLFDKRVMFPQDDTATGATGTVLPFPMPMGRNVITMKDKLTLGFDTIADWQDISSSSHQLICRVFYDKIKAPNDETSKLGNLSDL